MSRKVAIFELIFAGAVISFLLRLLLEISDLLTFSAPGPGQAMGWLSVHQYAKSQDFFYFFVATVACPICYACMRVPLQYIARLLARKTREPFERIWGHTSVASVPLYFCMLKVYSPARNSVTGLILPCVAASVLYFVLLLHRARKPSAIRNTTAVPQTGNIKPTMTVEEPALHTRRKDTVILGVFALLAYVYCLNPNVDGFADLYHEGEQLAPLQAAMSGQLPYRDVWIQHGVLRNFCVPQLAAAMFGTTLYGLRLLNRFLDPLGYIALFLLGTQLYRKKLLTSVLLILCTAGANYWVSLRQGLSLFSTFLLAAAINQDVIGAKEHPRSFDGRLLFASALSASLSFWYSLEFGSYTIFSSLCFLLVAALHSLPARGAQARVKISFVKPTLIYVSGLLLGIGGGLMLLGYYGVLGDAILTMRNQSAYQLDVWGLPFPSVAMLFQPLTEKGLIRGAAEFFSASTFDAYLSVLTLLLSGTYISFLLQERLLFSSRKSMCILLYTLSGLCFFRTALGRSDFGHWIDGSTYFWLLLLLPIDAVCTNVGLGLRIPPLGQKLKSLLLPEFIPAAAVLLYACTLHAPFGAFAARFAELRRSIGKPPATHHQVLRIGEVNLPTAQEQVLTEVVTRIQELTKSGESIYDFSNQAAYYFFADRVVPTRLFQTVYAATDEMQREIIEGISKAGTRVVVFKTGSAFDQLDGIPNEVRYPLIAKFLRDTFTLDRDILGTQILLKKQ